MRQTLEMARAGHLVSDLIEMMNAQRAYLSEIDGAIGDGDHGINMSKGFSQAAVKMAARAQPPSLPQALEDLALSLLEGIGGSMGPLYGGFFLAFSEVLEGQSQLTAQNFGDALSAALSAVQEVGGAVVGDKTLVDTLVPAFEAYKAALERGETFEQCLKAMTEAAERGKNSTIALQAKIGRASRLGARSVGVLDAGATSSFLILERMGRSIVTDLQA